MLQYFVANIKKKKTPYSLTMNLMSIKKGLENENPCRLGTENRNVKSCSISFLFLFIFYYLQKKSP